MRFKELCFELIVVDCRGLVPIQHSGEFGCFWFVAVFTVWKVKPERAGIYSRPSPILKLLKCRESNPLTFGWHSDTPTTRPCVAFSERNLYFLKMYK